MTGLKTNEREGTRAVLRHFHMSASKARVVLDLIRGEDVVTARDILANTNREAADVISKVLASAIANAVTNDHQNADDLYVATAYADEGKTMKRFSPRARSRAGRINKRSTHITIIVARMEDERIEYVRAARTAQVAASRSRRVASSRRRADQQASLNRRESAAAARAEQEAAEQEAAENEIAEHEHEHGADDGLEVAPEGLAEGDVDSTVDEAVDETVEATDETVESTDEETK